MCSNVFANNQLVICKYIAAQYPPSAKNIPCPRLSKPVYPQIRSTPSATMDKDKYLPRRLSLNTGSIVGAAIIKALIIAAPTILPVFRLNLLGRYLSLSIVALGVDLIWGYTGLLSLGQGIFFALGGYCAAMYLQITSWLFANTLLHNIHLVQKIYLVQDLVSLYIPR